MDQQMGFLVEALLIPAAIAGVLALGRKSMGRAILLASLISLGAAVVYVVLALVASGVTVFTAYGSQSGAAETALLAALGWLRSATFTIGFVLSIAAWMLSLCDAALRRRWTWFAAILPCACLSYTAASVWSSASFMEGDPLFGLLLRGVPLLSFFALSALAAASAVLTTIYASLMPRVQVPWMPLPVMYMPPVAYPYMPVPPMAPSAVAQMPATPAIMRPESSPSS